MEPIIQQILGEMMTYEPFNKIVLPAGLLNKIADKLSAEMEERKRETVSHIFLCKKCREKNEHILTALNLF